jgi:hypothetical protein
VFEYSQFDFTKFYLRFAHTMSRKRLAALLHGTPEGAPVFTAVEVAVITCNAVLSAMIQDNPWAVRRVLDALAAISTTRQARRRERGACRCHNRSVEQGFGRHGLKLVEIGIGASFNRTGNQAREEPSRRRP